MRAALVQINNKVISDRGNTTIQMTDFCFKTILNILCI